jgi:hypothetical protein
LPAQLSAEESLRGREFPPEMFFKLFSNPFMIDEYSYFFLMQTDIVPVGSYWADVIYQESFSSSYFWMKGSLTRRTDIGQGWVEYTMDSNAIYRLGSDCFNHFLERSNRFYKDHNIGIDLMVQGYRYKFALY